jgi:hypothetical protein
MVKIHDLRVGDVPSPKYRTHRGGNGGGESCTVVVDCLSTYGKNVLVAYFFVSRVAISTRMNNHALYCTS